MTAPKPARIKERRKAARHACSVKVECATRDTSFFDYIQDINAWGVYIQSRETVAVGESMLVSLPGYNGESAIKMIGDVVWTGPDGIGIKFRMGMGRSTLNAVIDNHPPAGEQR